MFGITDGFLFGSLDMSLGEKTGEDVPLPGIFIGASSSLTWLGGLSCMEAIGHHDDEFFSSSSSLVERRVDGRTVVVGIGCSLDAVLSDVVSSSTTWTGANVIKVVVVVVVGLERLGSSYSMSGSFFLLL
jgi:hypothetical protein